MRAGVIIMPGQFPKLNSDQSHEDVKYAYMIFFSNFNGSWNQYVDSFSSAIPGGLNLFWFGSIKLSQVRSDASAPQVHQLQSDLD
jgi:hypothetical protein